MSTVPSYSYVRLVTGESLVAEVVTPAVDNQTVHIIRPLQVMIDRVNGRTELLLFPYIPISSTDADSVTLSRQHVLFIVPVLEEVAKYMHKHALAVYEPDKTKKVGATYNPEEEAQPDQAATDEAMEIIRKLTNPGKKKPN